MARSILTLAKPCKYSRYWHYSKRQTGVLSSSKKGQFLELTVGFKKQLEELQKISEGNKVFQLNTGLLQELASEAADLQVDQAWQEHLKQIQKRSKHKPSVPKTLQADLRDYQQEGFQYLSRLANWGVGACLADDMGLGKTVQSITLLLEQAKHGPALVVAPTSVCFNWAEELSKFAPSLQITNLHQVADRDVAIASQAINDVLICSYGLLVQCDEALKAHTWRTIILDEAQAIKNPATKRWKVVTALNDYCRLALTGTPIENHLGELWSIFRFLNPGLLSSRQKFQENYLGPIERDNDAAAKRALKHTVAPYVLRRLKSAVLDELPPKTEQTVVIEPTAEEAAFYEAVRMRALEKIANTKESQASSKRFTILAEITKLRQACCHPKLIDNKLSVPSSKIKTFLRLLDDILENNHKVLVFSQFVGYLDLVRSEIEAKKIAYQYIDGATTAKKRKVGVEAFQSGDGDVFLLSLKAGGTGLNLTAADYVIHLDPWWNPAVEDQPSDRAHRLGQQRPVTVYRLVMQNTIEENMLAMHADKRDLATDLLSGSELSGKISEAELLQLLGGWSLICF